MQHHAERGRAGQAVLTWLAANYNNASVALDPRSASDADLIMSAQRWLDAGPLQPAQSASGTPSSLPIAA
ncbi:hypothetical protein ACVWZN_000938 [Lysobacter sp. HA35]